MIFDHLSQVWARDMDVLPEGQKWKFSSFAVWWVLGQLLTLKTISASSVGLETDFGQVFKNFEILVILAYFI